MARISDLELERLKREVSLERLCEAKGIELKRAGDSLLGRCPFHEDKTPSFVVTPSKNLWHCLGACCAGGSVIDFVMKSEVVSFRHAVELLRDGAPLSSGPAGASNATRTLRLPALVTSTEDDGRALADVVDYYHRTLLQSPEALKYLEQRGLRDEALIRHFRLGFANRTLGLRLPSVKGKEGAAVREKLQRLGVLRESGHEFLNGSLVVPLLDEAGAVVGLYGRKVTENLRTGTPLHLYLPGPHRTAFNSAALAECKTVILCEAIFDALSFWRAGYHAVLAAYGVDGFTPHHLEALKRHRVRSVLLAYDRDDAGDAAAASLATRLRAEGFDCWRVLFPRGMDANEYALKVQPATASLGVALRQAQYLGPDGSARPPPAMLASKRVPASPLAALAAASPAAAERVAQPGAQGERKVAMQASARMATAAPPVAPPAPGASRRSWLVGAKPVASAVALPISQAAPLVPPSVMGTAVDAAPEARNAPPINQAAPLVPSSVMGAAVSAVATAVTTISSPIPTAASMAAATTIESTTTSSSAAGERSSPPPLPTSAPAAPTPDTSSPMTTEDEAVFSFDSRRYRVRGLAKSQGTDALRVNVLLSRGEAPSSGAGQSAPLPSLGPGPSTPPGTGFHVDTFDMYSAKARAAFVAQASAECGLDVATVKQDVGQLLLQLEGLVERRRAAAEGPKVPVLTQEEREAALELLRTPDLLARVLEDFARCGVVGEETNKLVGYLAAVSRKLEEPLAVLIQSSSAAGKSSLMEAVLAFVPEEERVKYSAMTGQSLFYMGDADLKHKVLAVVEEEGAARASYALKLLQSEGELTIASTGKDPHTGRLVTHEYHVEGPTQLFLTTTATELDDELLNRCLVLSVDEDRAQTSAIHRLQREKRTLEGRFGKKERDAVLKVHQDAQRMLRPLAVVNPFAPSLTFPDDRTRMRRDFPKYLTLIDAIALLHQHQRPVKTATRGPHVVEYVEVQLSDIEAANRLAGAVLGRTLDELPPQTRRLLHQLEAWVTRRAELEKRGRGEVAFTRREVREALGFRNSQLALHLGRLVDFEYLEARRGPRGLFAYALATADAGAPSLAGLADAGTLREGPGPGSAPGPAQALQFPGGGVSFRGASGPPPGTSKPKEDGGLPPSRAVSGGAVKAHGGSLSAMSYVRAEAASP